MYNDLNNIINFGYKIMLVVITLGVWYYQYILSLCDKFAFFIKLSHYNILS